jgi:hypothetical protein
MRHMLHGDGTRHAPILPQRAIWRMRGYADKKATDTTPQNRRCG